MRFAGSLGKSASDLFAELFPTGTVSLDALQSSPSDASPAPPASSNPEHAEATAQNGPPQPAELLADDGTDGSPPDLVGATAGTAAEASSQHVPASAAFFQDQTTDSDNGFYALSSDAYWSNDEGVSHRPAELGADDHDGDLAAPINGSDAASAAGFDSPHFTFNDGAGAVSSNAPTPAEPSSGAAASSAPVDTNNAAAPASHPSETPPALMVVDDLGSFGASTAGSGGTGGTLVSGSSGSSGLVINVVWDSSVANAPAGFTADVLSVVSYFESYFSNPVTITIDVGYGEVDGQSLGAGALGESATNFNSVSYSVLQNALAANLNAIGDTAAAASLPATSPVNGQWWVSTAQSEALGLTSVSNNPDGYVGFSSAPNMFAYNDSNGVPSSQYDFFGVVAHEISEVMGREIFDGTNPFGTGASYDALDLFHYSAPGVRVFTGYTGYASADNGQTSLDAFNTIQGGDLGDWASSAGNDAFNAFSNPGVITTVTQSDLTTLNLLGWDPATSGGAPA